MPPLYSGTDDSADGPDDYHTESEDSFTEAERSEMIATGVFYGHPYQPSVHLESGSDVDGTDDSDDGTDDSHTETDRT